MADKLDYALITSRVHDRPAANRIPLSQGWQENAWYGDEMITGFSAGVYQRGNEIVIS